MSAKHSRLALATAKVIRLRVEMAKLDKRMAAADPEHLKAYNDLVRRQEQLNKLWIAEMGPLQARVDKLEEKRNKKFGARIRKLSWQIDQAQLRLSNEIRAVA